MKTKYLLVLASMVILLGLGCSKQPKVEEIQSGKIDGSVFIVTESAENIKLGLVTVALFDQEKIKPSLSNIQQLLITNNNSFLANEQKTDQDDESEIKKYKDKIDELQNAYLKNLENNFADDMSRGELQKNIMETYKIGMTNYIEAAKKERDDRLDHFYTDQYKICLDNLPVPIDTQKTDADGKFSFSIKLDANYVLVASAQRKVADKTEEYFWIVGVNTKGKPSTQIFLSNDNMVTTSSQDSLIKIQAPASATSQSQNSQ